MNKLTEIINESTMEDEMIKSQFDAMIDQIYGTFKMWGSTYSASFIAKRCDPIQYEIRLTGYKDELEEQENDLHESVNTEDMPENIKNIISDSEQITEDVSEDLDIISSNLKTNTYLGVYDGVYYIKVGEYWEEIPAETYQEALDTFNDIVKSKFAEIYESEQTEQSELEDETIIQEEQEIEIIRSNFEPEIYLGKTEDKKYFISVRKR